LLCLSESRAQGGLLTLGRSCNLSGSVFPQPYDMGVRIVTLQKAVSTHEKGHCLQRAGLEEALGDWGKDDRRALGDFGSWPCSPDRGWALAHSSLARLRLWGRRPTWFSLGLTGHPSMLLLCPSSPHPHTHAPFPLCTQEVAQAHIAPKSQIFGHKQGLPVPAPAPPRPPRVT
jgi:hypothetical protein